MAARVTQFAIVSIQGPPTSNARVSQFGIMSIQGPPFTPIKVTQLATMIITSNNIGYLSLKNPINLDCWQPCTAYATPARIYILD